MKQHLRHIPPVHELQQDERFLALMEQHSIGEQQLTSLVQEGVAELRKQILAEAFKQELTIFQFKAFIFQYTKEELRRLIDFKLKRVINATGTIVHTNLGRSRLSEEAIRLVVETAANYSNLEYDLSEGKRGSRHSIIEDWLVKATGAEAAMVVNNNAAAVYLILRALAKDKEVIVSRGELVEIGGSFRVSSIMEESGAQLVEVGTTNKTHLYDYEDAIHEKTAMVMKVHTSNFKTIGFTKSVGTAELVNLTNEHENVLFYEDLGSGALYDFTRYQIGDEPIVSKVLSLGVDIVSFSGDKLLGGPQAGIIAGKRSIISKLKKHQLARVLRVDKMTLAALEATLKAYVLGDEEIKKIPTVRDALQSIEEIKERGKRFVAQFTEDDFGFQIELTNEFSQIGGGTMPDVKLPTIAAAVSHQNSSTQHIVNRLRSSSPSIVTRVKDEKVIIDFRTLTDQEADTVALALRTMIS